MPESRGLQRPGPHRIHLAQKAKGKENQNDRQNARARGKGTQPEKHRCGHPAEQDRGHCGRVGVGQILAGAGGAVCRRLPPVSGGAVHLYPPPDDPGFESLGGRCAVCSGGAGAAPEAGRAGHPQHLRHRHGAFEQPAAHVLPPRKPPLPERALHPADAGCCGGQGAGLPGVRCAFLCAVGGGAGFQLSRCLPEVRRHRQRPDGGHGVAGAGRLADHRRRRSGPVEQPDVVADDRRLPGDGREDGCAVPRPDRTGKGHRLPRSGREKAYLLPRQELESGRRAGLYLLQRRLHRRKCSCKGQG